MDQKPDQIPQSESAVANPVYAGFWIRLGASTIDSILFLVLIIPLLIGIYGIDYLLDLVRIVEDLNRALQLWEKTGNPPMNLILSAKTEGGVWEFLITWVMPAVVIIVFWIYRSATPGKMMVRVKIADAKTGHEPSTGQVIWRYFGYFVSIIPFMLGILWVAFDKRKQGWHDKLAGTIVVKT
ncbi:MAG TPA: RDD family protein [Nitrospirales bacterium]|nr:RDD family protein [Nitrospirales bacterium]HIA14018.1 RDD family protein [Nitrospirales bacterium]HIC04531.1 RDD family protein [Nitrospirales bacterium]HIN32484.1 RDD family protein [Nitrospirales bacterium]HIO69919.1 RDD family protein [Nitrospirales bacterium]